MDTNLPDLLKELKKSGLFPEKKLGQHFLFDQNILQKIVESAPPLKGRWVLEIGPGPGGLTRELLLSGARVIAVEKDQRFVDFLKTVFHSFIGKDLFVINEDALKLDIGSLLSKPEIMVANLPYNIAATLIVDYLVKYPFLKEYLVMVQREVALRFASSPGTKDYSSLSVKVQLLADVDLMFKVAPGSFFPPPRVESQVIRLKRNLRLAKEEILNFISYVDLFFAYRRKTLLNNLLISGFFGTRDEAKKFLDSIGINANARPEEIAPEQYLKIYFALKKEFQT